jgi:hypothetical protein
MLGMNLWGTIYNLIYMFGWPHGIGYEAIEFCKHHPEAAWDIFLYCLCGAVGQNFIFLTISRFGSLANTTITTTRKFVSIVVSSVLSGNPLSAKQSAWSWCSLGYHIRFISSGESCRNCKRRESLCDYNSFELYMYLFFSFNLFNHHFVSVKINGFKFTELVEIVKCN